MYGWKDVRKDLQISPVFYRTLSPPVPSGADALLSLPEQGKGIYDLWVTGSFIASNE